MKRNSALQLSETLQGKMEMDSQQIQLLHQTQLKQLVQSLRDTLNAELNTTQSAIRSEIASLGEMTAKSAASLTLQQQSLSEMTAKSAASLTLQQQSLSETTAKSAASLTLQQQSMLEELQRQQSELMQALRQSTRAAVTSLRWSWLRATVPALAVLAVTLSASWGLMHWWTSQAISLRADIITSQQTLESLPQGVQFMTNRQGESFLVMQREPQKPYRSKSGDWVVILNK